MARRTAHVSFMKPGIKFLFRVCVTADMSTEKGAGKSAGNRWRPNSSSNSGVIRRQPYGMNRSSPLDSEGLPPNTERRAMGLLDVMVDQLPMLTEKGLRDLQLAVATEISFRGDVRESLNETRHAEDLEGTSEFAASMVLGVEQTVADRYDPFNRPRALIPERHASSVNEEMRAAEESDDHDPAFEPDQYWDVSGAREVEVEFTPDGTPVRVADDGQGGGPVRSRRRR